MIYYRFANYSKGAILEVLEKIGKVRFEQTIKNTGLPKPKEMANFKLEKEAKVCAVMYKYPGDTRYTCLFVVKDYEMHSKGWVWENYAN